jgi:hypothetical protein
MIAPDFSRRGFIHRIVLGAGIANATLSVAVHAQKPPPPAGPFSLPPLPYAFDALEPLVHAVPMGGS